MMPPSLSCKIRGSGIFSGAAVDNYPVKRRKLFPSKIAIPESKLDVFISCQGIFCYFI